MTSLSEEEGLLTVEMTEDHRYFVRGSGVHHPGLEPDELPSVTRILEDENFRAPWRGDDYYLDRGTRLHKAVELEETVGVDEDSIAEDIQQAFGNWRRWKKAVGWETLESELMMFDQDFHRYAGTADLVGTMKGRPERWVIDLKCSKAASRLDYWLQADAYSCLWGLGAGLSKPGVLFLNDKNPTFVDVYRAVRDVGIPEECFGWNYVLNSWHMRRRA